VRVRQKPRTASDGDGRLTSALRSKVAIRAVIVLMALLALWGYLRGLGGQLGGVMKGIRQVAPQAEERNRLVRELADQPKGTEPK